MQQHVQQLEGCTCSLVMQRHHTNEVCQYMQMSSEQKDTGNMYSRASLHAYRAKLGCIDDIGTIKYNCSAMALTFNVVNMTQSFFCG